MADAARARLWVLPGQEQLAEHLGAERIDGAFYAPADPADPAVKTLQRRFGTDSARKRVEQAAGGVAALEPLQSTSARSMSAGPAPAEIKSSEDLIAEAAEAVARPRGRLTLKGAIPLHAADPKALAIDHAMTALAQIHGVDGPNVTQLAEAQINLSLAAPADSSDMHRWNLAAELVAEQVLEGEASWLEMPKSASAQASSDAPAEIAVGAIADRIDTKDEIHYRVLQFDQSRVEFGADALERIEEIRQRRDGAGVRDAVLSSDLHDILFAGGYRTRKIVAVSRGCASPLQATLMAGVAASGTAREARTQFQTTDARPIAVGDLIVRSGKAEHLLVLPGGFLRLNIDPALQATVIRDTKAAIAPTAPAAPVAPTAPAAPAAETAPSQDNGQDTLTRAIDAAPKAENSAVNAERLAMARAANVELARKGVAPARPLPETPAGAKRLYFYTAREASSPYHYKKLDSAAKAAGVALLIDRDKNSPHWGLRHLDATPAEMARLPESLSFFLTDAAHEAHLASRAAADAARASTRDAAESRVAAQPAAEKAPKRKAVENVYPITIPHPERDKDGFVRATQAVRRMSNSRLIAAFQETRRRLADLKIHEDAEKTLGRELTPQDKGRYSWLHHGLVFGLRVLQERGIIAEYRNIPDGVRQAAEATARLGVTVGSSGEAPKADKPDSTPQASTAQDAPQGAGKPEAARSPQPADAAQPVKSGAEQAAAAGTKPAPARKSQHEEHAI